MKRSFSVNAVWDDEDQIWLSESDISGLHIEVKTLGLVLRPRKRIRL